MRCGNGSWSWFRSLSFGFLIVAGGAIASAQAQEKSEQGKRVTLADAKRYAVSHNFSLLGAREGVETADALTQHARSSFFPKLAVVGGAESKQGSSTGEVTALGYLSANVNIFNGFADQKRVDVANLEKEKADAALTQQTLELELEVERIYYLYLFKKRALDSHEDSLKTNDKHRNSLKARRSAGMVSESDVMDFELRDSLLKSQVASLQKDLKELQLNLVRLLGPNLGTAITPTGDLPHFHIKGDLKSYLSTMDQKSAAIKSASLNREQADLKVSVERASWLPKIDLEAQAGYLSKDDRLANSDIGFKGLATARWEFFSGFETSSQLRVAATEAKRLEYTLKQQILTSMANVENSYNRLRSIEERVDLEEANEDRATKLYNSIWKEYNRGVKTSGDVKDAEEALLDARLRRAEFKWQFIEQKIALEKEIGRSVETEHFGQQHAR